MAKVVISPDKKNIFLDEFIERLAENLPTDKISNSNILNKFSIHSINIYIREKRMEIFVECPEGFEIEQVQNCFIQLLHEFIPQLECIDCKWKEKRRVESLKEGFKEAWPDLLHKLQEYLPTSNGWLERAKWKVQGQTLEILIESTFGLNQLKNKRCDEYIRSYVRDELGFDVEVKLGVYEVELAPPPPPKFIPPSEVPPPSFLSDFGNGEIKNNNGGSKSRRHQSKPEEGALLGKKISDNEKVTPLKEITDEERSIVVEGKVFKVEERELKSGRKIISFNITDYTDSITGKIFVDADNELGSQIKKGVWLRCRGKVQIDKFSQELTLWPDDMMEIDRKDGRQDDAPKKRVELHAHTKMSAMDSVADVSDLVNTAISWGHKAIAITDHGVVQAFPEAFNAAKGKIKIIYGVEAYFMNDGEAIVLNATDKPLDQIEWVVFDVETTGFNPTEEEIIEIGAVKIKDGKIIDRFSTFVNPGRSIPARITELTGIDDNMVAGAPTIAEIMPDFIEFFKDSVLVAHNAMFDYRFLTAALEKTGYSKLISNITILDTLNLSRALLPDLKKHRLNSLAEYFEVNLENHHRACDDAEATGEIFLKLLEMLNKDITTLNEVNNLSKEIDWKRLKTYHLCILVKNSTGLKNLYKLISKSHLDYFYRHPRIPRSLLQKYRDGLLIGSACEAGYLYRRALQGASDEELKEIIRFYDYIELQPLGNNSFLVDQGQVGSLEELKELNKRIYQLAKEEGRPVIAAGDVHFIEPRDAIFREILMTAQGFEDAENQAPLYLRTTEEMLEEFSYFGENIAREIVIENTNLIADMIEDIRPVPEGVYPPKIPGADKEIREMTYKRAREIYGEELPEIIEKRLEKELKAIIDNGYAVNYLIAHKLVKKSLDDGYLVGSRGSVGSSLVATMCGITEVNPMPPHYICEKCKYSEFITDGSVGSGPDLPDKDCPNCGQKLIKEGHDIPFEVFMGFKGDKVPDIDLNFSGEYQSVVHKYTEELFGRDYVFRAGTISTVAERTAYGFVKNYLEEKGITARSAEIERLVKGCAGVRRTTGQHPGGLMIVPNDKEIYDFCPIQHPANDVTSDVITTHFDYHSIHDNLLKLDILGHDDPTTIRMLQDLTGIDPRKIPLDDLKTMKIFSSTEPLGLTPEQLGTTVGTFGIPEFGTQFVRGMLEETRPTTFAELVRISGLSHGTDVWLNNAQDLVRSGTAQLAEVISVRDDIMNYLILKGVDNDKAFKIMEKVRKGKGLTEEEEALMREHDVPEWYIESCKKIKYMFPKAHAAAYVMMAFRIAYFKVHYPLEFYATYFTIKADDFDAQLVSKGQDYVRKMKEKLEAKGSDATAKEKGILTVLEIVLEAMLRGIEFDKVDLYRSHPTKFLIDPETKKLIPPFVSLQGLGESAARSIAASREEGEFKSIEDLATRARLSKTVIEVLKEHGTLDGLPEKNQLSLFGF
ncbi:PolC-type DNA polymerase III [Anoxybacter fermentans]|uniref:DNA polymerase III PolC-type n=1 Tax=Anoxybacter fermentans TaxID=1323375 RepID=A0A3Q9HNY9_9FIRM|nr:PolC-type DNA polymerase III [Anoxybacter fermentans]AZR72387.1 PolC-type DNA polymerase III [Anoxybacter fermentans]